MQDLQKIREGYNRLRQCTLADHCEQAECEYYTRPDDLAEVLDFLQEALRQAEQEGNFQ